MYSCWTTRLIQGLFSSMSHFPDLILGLWMWDTPTMNVLGHSSDIGSLGLMLPIRNLA